MAIPKELTCFSSEDDFTQRFLIPMLKKLGFDMIVNSHGSREFGRDLIFAEFDRFGHIRYHAMQAKFVPSISVNDVTGLITDANLAFTNPFEHPQTGTKEPISTFYAVNAGSISEGASATFFNGLRLLAGNVRLIAGKDLIALDRSATMRVRIEFGTFHAIGRKEGFFFKVTNLGTEALPPYRIELFHPDRGTMSMFDHGGADALLPDQERTHQAVILGDRNSTLMLEHWLGHIRDQAITCPDGSGMVFRLRMHNSQKVLYENRRIGETLGNVLIRAIREKTVLRFSYEESEAMQHLDPAFKAARSVELDEVAAKSGNGRSSVVGSAPRTVPSAEETHR